MEGERFGCHEPSFIQGAAGADAIWKIRKRNAVVAIDVFVDQGDVLTHRGVPGGPCASRRGEARVFGSDHINAIASKLELNTTRQAATSSRKPSDTKSSSPMVHLPPVMLHPTLLKISESALPRSACIQTSKDKGCSTRQDLQSHAPSRRLPRRRRAHADYEQRNAQNNEG
jgi:hypothetical protein